MSSCINLLKNCAQLSVADACKSFDCNVEVETIVLHNSDVSIHRVYFKNKTHDETLNYTDVGWVLNCDITNCMICDKTFWFFLARHHCRSCGNSVCDGCSRSRAIIKELPTCEPQRVCSLCYWGQVDSD